MQSIIGSSLKKWLFGVAIFLIAMLVLVPQFSDLQKSLENVANAYWPYILLAIVAWGWTFVAAAGVYMIISPRGLPFRQVLLVQVVCGFANRLIPAGAGALATNAKFLMSKGYSKVQAGTMVAINNIVGFAASFIVLVGAGLLTGLDLINGIRLEIFLSDRLIVAVMVITALVMLYAWVTRLPRKLLWLVKKINYQIENSLLKSNKLLTSLVMSMGVTIGYGLCLHFTALALNVPLSAFQTFLVLNVGVLVASITPTPGGIGGAEAGLVGVLSAVGVDIHQAVSLALTYRFITYWLPILPGYLAFNVARQRKLL